MRSTKCGFSDIPGGSTGSDSLVQWGPTLLVDIGFDPNFEVGSGTIPVPGLKELNALVDTGATESCIDSLLASQLNLPIVDKRITAGAHGAKEVNMHLAQVYIPTLSYTIWGAFAGVDLLAGGQIHAVLIGRTFLQAFRMTYDGPTGTVEISE